MQWHLIKQFKISDIDCLFSFLAHFSAVFFFLKLIYRNLLYILEMWTFCSYMAFQISSLVLWLDSSFFNDTFWGIEVIHFKAVKFISLFPDVNFIISLAIPKNNAPTLFFLKRILAVLCTLHFHVNFGISLSNIVKICVGFWWEFIEFIGQFEKIDIMSLQCMRMAYLF